MVTPGKFQLTKWYFDCVSDAGETAIFYCARVHWRGLALSYSSYLFLGHDGVIHTRSSVRPFRQPAENNEVLEVDLSSLKAKGIWRAQEASISRNILSVPRGLVQWTCLQPRSEVTLRIQNAPPINGLGYAECVTLTVPPWELPLTQLQWGRFLSREHSLVWIDWQGPANYRLVFHNGTACGTRKISERSIVLANGTVLNLDCGRPLRNGKLGETILPATPVLRKFFPLAMFNVRECKWRSQGRLQIGDREIPGWAIHEVVDWAR